MFKTAHLQTLSQHLKGSVDLPKTTHLPKTT